MRFLFLLSMVVAVTAQAQPAAYRVPSAIQRSDCPSAASHFAGKGGTWRGTPLRPMKLAELPPADTYAAMLRTDERGCMVPVKYRDTRR